MVESFVFFSRGASETSGALFFVPMFGKKERLSYLWDMIKTNTPTMNNLQTLQNLRSELKTLASDWSETHNQLDANCVIVTLPSKMWRVAKELGCRKDYHYGYILFSKSTNSNGSDFACEVQSICHQHGAPVIVRERQL